MNQKSRQECPDAGAEKKIQIHDVAQHGAAENRVRETVTNIAHAAENDVNADEAAERANHHRGKKAVAKKLVLEGD